jgi:hypothetical protein
MRFYGNQYNILTNLIWMASARKWPQTTTIWFGKGLAYTEHPQKDDIFYSRASAYGGNESDNWMLNPANPAKLSCLVAQRTAIKTKYFTAAFIPQSRVSLIVLPALDSFKVKNSLKSSICT